MSRWEFLPAQTKTRSLELTDWVKLVDAETIRVSGASLLIVRRQEDGAWKVALKMDTRSEKPEAANEQNETGH